MSLLIQKFGGTCVATSQDIKLRAKQVAASIAAGHRVVVIVSAMAGDTDRLQDLALTQSNTPQAQELASLLTTGERVTAALMAMALHALGLKAESFDGARAGIKTSAHYTKAAITDIDTQALQRALANNVVPVVCGFQGDNQQGRVTALGRGGSDVSAVALAAALGAEECQIFTDVDGVYSADPNVVAEAQWLAKISYPEMLAMAAHGTKVLQYQAVEYGYRHAVLIRVLSVASASPGTCIVPGLESGSALRLSGISLDRNQGKLIVVGIKDVARAREVLRQQLAQAHIRLDMVMLHRSQHPGLFDIKLTVHLDDFNTAQTLLVPLAEQFSAKKLLGDNSIAKLSIIGLGMQDHAGIANQLLEKLHHAGIAIDLLSSEAVKVSMVIAREQSEQAANLLHHSVFSKDCNKEYV